MENPLDVGDRQDRLVLECEDLIAATEAGPVGRGGGIDFQHQGLLAG